MQKVISKILAQKVEYQYEIGAIDECLRIEEKIKNIVNPSFNKDFPILKYIFIYIFLLKNGF